MRRSAFTAVEVLLVLGTLGISATLTVPMYRQYLLRNDLEIGRQNVAQGIQRAKFLSQVAMNDSSWGFSTDSVPGRGVLFMGSNYATRDTSFDELYSLPNTITVTGVTEVSFSKITGLPDKEGIITLTSISGDQRMVTISIGSEGNVTIPDDWLIICVDPYGDSPYNISVPDSLWQYYSGVGAILGECGEGGPTCGNGYKEAGEQCDVGGQTADCDGDCTDVSCGDGTLNTSALEQCDDGNSNDGDGCDSNCVSEICGNGVTQTGEECDDMGETATCDEDCTVASCGDSTVNATASEECDDGGESASCNSNCTNSSCGDSVLNITDGEECDDGNTTPGDGCDASCQNEPQCGNGSVEGDEECDDGNSTPGDGCDAACLDEVCGNSIVQSGEDCDDGGESATCDSNCTNQECGDNTMNSTAGEECDDGNITNNDGCSSVCLNEVCGDSIVQTSEGCDDGNVVAGDGCSETCQTEGVGGGITFTIVDNGIIPDQDYTCTVEVLGAAIQSGGDDLPVTLRLKEDGVWTDPFGNWELPVDSNVNGGETYSAACESTDIDSGVAVHVKARSWEKRRSWYSGTSNSHWEELLTVSTDSGSPNVEVLVDGDTIPDYDPLNEQGSIEDFVAEYIDLVEEEMSMASNEVIYLFELGTTNLGSSAADFQDLVLLLTLEAI